MNQNIKGSASMALDSYQESFFRYDSDLRWGDIFQDQMSMERHILLSLQKVGPEDTHAGLKASSCRCNDQFILYQLIASAPADSFGKVTYTTLVKVNDYCHASHWARGDSMTEIGDLERGQLFIIFSARKLLGYLPVQGDRCHLGNGSGEKYQTDHVDSHVFPGCYRVLCSLDKRI